MTYLIRRMLQTQVWRSQFLVLALTSLALIALQATPASAQWTTGTNINNTNTGSVAIGTTTPTANFKLDVSGAVVFNSSSDIVNSLLINSGNIDKPAFQVLMPATGQQKAFQLANTGNSSGWASFEYNVGATGKPGLSLGSGSAVRDTKIFRDSVGVLRTNSTMIVDGNLTVAGAITGATINAKYQDVAEWVPASEQIPAGTVVVLDSTKSNHVISSTSGYDTRVAGVISAQPGIALGERGDSKVLVATTGRVRIKVDATRTPIHVGDLLVTSDMPGVAMKSEPIKLGGRLMHMPGTLIGKALEPLEKGSGTILVLLSLQ